MERIYEKLQELEAKRKQDISDDVKETDLQKSGLKGITLRSYQLEGVDWLLQRWRSGHGCVLGDEMGLGKTCQTVSFVTHLVGANLISGPALVVSPLSVIANWQDEFKRFSPNLEVVSYIGGKDERHILRQGMKKEGAFNVLLSTYEICMKDAEFLGRFRWSILIVDEAHRLKNSNSLLYQTLRELKINHRFLLTGTPVQNNLSELYSLLSFTAPKVFKLSACEAFVEEFQDVANKDVKKQLHNLLKPFLLRRTKNEVVLDLPKKSEVLLFHGMSALQKKLYKAILTKDMSTFQELQGTNKTSLMNVLMQLRKCVSHPYMFNGVEPEPFELGDHLIDVSGKLHLLDQVLRFLSQHGHKVLLFSQMTHMLDILQDYLGYRGYSYERLDGSVRGEERFLAVRNFNRQEETFIFLLSTKAGGVGLNLVGADTVIFVDSDFNPQNDIQAAARAHRIGQTRPVKVIRLVGKDTVEEVILRRADIKLKLTNRVIEGGQFSSIANVNNTTFSHTQLSDMLKFGLEKLLQSEDSTVDNIDLQSILGASVDGQWTLPEETSGGEKGEDMEVDEQQDHIYMFEGKDYSKETTEADQNAFNALVAVEVESCEESANAPRSRRQTGTTSTAFRELTAPVKKRRELTEEEKAERKKKREEAAARRAKLQEEAEIRRAQERKQKLEEFWKCNDYTSCNICLDSDQEEEQEGGEQGLLGADEGEEERLDISYVRGDVTHPVCKNGDAIVVHCVDDSGSWGQGGLFTALSNRSQSPETQYELAGNMKDLALGDTHLVPIDDMISRDSGHDYVALIVAQHRDRNNTVSGIKLAALDQGLQRIYKIAKEKKASVHLPRIGHSTPGFNWYGTERLIKKHLAYKGIESTVYYYPRRGATKHCQQSSDRPSASASDDEAGSGRPTSKHSKEKKVRKEDRSSESNVTAIAGPSRGAKKGVDDEHFQATGRPQVSSSEDDGDGMGPATSKGKRKRPFESDDGSAKISRVPGKKGDRKPPDSKRLEVSSSDSDEDGSGDTIPATSSRVNDQRKPQTSDDVRSPRPVEKQRKHPAPSAKMDVSSSDDEVGDCATSSLRYQAQKKPRGGEKGNGPDESSTHSGTEGSAKLDDRLKGVRVFLDQSLSEDERRKLQRYIVAYDGEVEAGLSRNTTHVIADADEANKMSLEDYPHTKVVTSRWLWDSIVQKKILD